MFVIKSNKGITDVSGYHIKLVHNEAHTVHNVTIDESWTLNVECFRTETKFVLSKFSHQKPANNAYNKISNALKNNKHYVDITDSEKTDKYLSENPSEDQSA